MLQHFPSYFLVHDSLFFTQMVCELANILSRNGPSCAVVYGDNQYLLHECSWWTSLLNVEINKSQIIISYQIDLSINNLPYLKKYETINSVQGKLHNLLHLPCFNLICINSCILYVFSCVKVCVSVSSMHSESMGA